MDPHIEQSELETAAHPENLRRVAIDPVSRVEGHGKVTILLDENNQVHQVRLHIVEFRGFEKFIQGRPYWEVPVMVQRLCGICPVSHHLAASKAMDMIVGATLTPTAEKMRRLMHYGQILQSHALHFFHLCSPDLLFGFDSDVAKRNIVGIAAAYPGDRKARRAAAQVRPGSDPRHRGQARTRHRLDSRRREQEREHRGTRLPAEGHRADRRLEPRRGGIARQLHEQNLGAVRQLRRFQAHTLILVRADGALDLYHGGLRARDMDGNTLFDHLTTATTGT